MIRITSRCLCPPSRFASTSSMQMDESPFKTMLNTNTVPSDAECDAIHAFLASHTTKLAELDAETARLRNLLNTVVLERNHLQDFVDAHKALVSPMRRVPEDILRLVFLKTLPEDRGAAMHPSEGPLLLSRVCRYWRDLALATPQLWSSIHIVVPHHSESDRVQQVVTSLARWLERGGAAPLDVSLHRSRPQWRGDLHVSAELQMDAGSGPGPFPLFSALLAASPRWRDMKLLLHYFNDQQALTVLQAHDVPQLRTIDLLPIHHVQLPFLATPSLRHLTTEGRMPLFPENIAWHNLVSLDIQAMYSMDQPAPAVFPFPFLPHCVSLERLAVSIAGGNPLIPGGVDAFALPRLTTLDIGVFDVSVNVSPAIALISTPMLHTVEIAQSLFTPDILRHMSHIRHLVLSIHDMPTEMLTTALRLVPGLERLRLIGEPTRPADPLPGFGFPHLRQDPDYLAQLLPGPEGAVCPALRHLELANVRYAADTLVIRLLRARTVDVLPGAGIARLTEFSCNFSRGPGLDIRAALADCSGLKLRTTYHHVHQWPGYSALEGTERDPALSEGSFSVDDRDTIWWDMP
ncbi:F-box domain-containing protein [Mycena indigotica]|uniref:F-box domain-containing protein n=1 Tax=Mycena indigotica TaxID=2126181 RepID=A0A8H6S371_9AGAR|nr:F-box domain-containing protein [Mycena indigotica]KAF7291405.1 F-box domain-containing protein [Mycena indigotica]